MTMKTIAFFNKSLVESWPTHKSQLLLLLLLHFFQAVRMPYYFVSSEIQS